MYFKQFEAERRRISLTGLVILLTCIGSVKAQKQFPLQDSLSNVIAQSDVPKSRILTLDRLATAWYGVDFGEMALVSRQLIQECQRHGMQQGLVSGYNKLGIALMSLSRYDEAQEALEKGYLLADSLGDARGLPQIVANLGIVCYYQENWPCAERFYREALTLNEGPALKNILARGYFNLAILFHDQKELDSARRYYTLAESVSREIQDTVGLMDVFNSVGVLYEEGGDQIQAQRYFQLALEFARRSGLREPLFMPYLNLARLAMDKKQLGRARSLMDSARHVAKSLDSYDFMQDAFQAQSRLDSISGNIRQALHWARYYDQVKDSLNKRERITRMAEMQARFQTREAEKDLALMKVQAAQTEADLVYQRRLFWAISGLALCLAGLAMVYFWFNRKNSAMLAKLREAYREKDALLGIVAHDLKAPLANIQGLAHMLGEGQLKEPEQNRVLGMIHAELGRGDQLVRDLLELDAIENGTLYMNAESLDLVGFLRQQAERYQFTAAKKEIALTEDIPLSQCTCETDKQLLSRVLDNLISNAIKFSPWGRNVNLGLRAEASEAIISITDEGPGFNEEDMQLVFQKFRKLSAKPTGGESSSGLGLAIVKGLIDSLGGSIHLESQPGAGARFEIRLPVLA